jgi:hypothetical protein
LEGLAILHKGGVTLKIMDLPFGVTDWSDVEKTEHSGEQGLAYWRTVAALYSVLVRAIRSQTMQSFTVHRRSREPSCSLSTKLT